MSKKAKPETQKAYRARCDIDETTMRFYKPFVRGDYDKKTNDGIYEMAYIQGIIGAYKRANSLTEQQYKDLFFSACVFYAIAETYNEGGSF